MRIRWLIIISLLTPLTSCQESKNTFTITWKNIDGSVLEVDENVPKGVLPFYNKGLPTYGPVREEGSSSGTTYYFYGWDSELTEVTEDKTYTASYSTQPNYDVKWVNDDGEVLQHLGYVVKGFKPTYSGNLPKKENVEDQYFAFTGWNEEQHAITSDTVYKAQYASEGITKFSDYDGDGLVDHQDPNYRSINNEVSYKYESDDRGKLNFAMDYVNYFIKGDPNVFSKDTAKCLSALNIDIDFNGHISFPLEPSDFDNKKFIYQHMGCDHIEDFYLNASDYSSDKYDLGGAVLAHHKIVGGTIGAHPDITNDYDVFFVTIKPSTSKNNDCWKSNIDIGSEDDSYTQLTGEHPDWDDKDYHKGLYVTAKRVKERVDTYLNQSDFQSLDNKILVISGHSRGGAIANYIAKQYKDNTSYKTFAYTFATPEYYYGDEDTITNYPYIINLVNDDDLVLHIPHDDFSGKRFGRDIHFSINDTYIGEYNQFASHKYNMANNIDDFIDNDLKPVIPTRDDIYKLDESIDRCKGYSHTFITSSLAENDYNEKLELLNKYGIDATTGPYYYHLIYDKNNKTVTGYNCPGALIKIAFAMLDMPDISLADALKLLDIFDNYNGIFDALTEKLGIDLDNPLAKIINPHCATCYYVMADNYSPS